MKKMISLLLALALSAFFAAGSLAEEFFSEETFVTGAGAGEESFFEEGFFGGDFFAEDDFSGAPAEEPEGEPAEDGAEERSVQTMSDKTDEGYMFAGTPAEIPPTLLTPSVVDAKPNEVRLDWEHCYRNVDYYPSEKNPQAIKSVKLPAGTAYYVYERDMIYGAGVWRQVAKTTKRTVTLKNVPGGYHQYFVRLEYTGKGAEYYGNRSNLVYVDIMDVGMWKTFSQVSIVQRATAYGSTSGYDPIIRIRSKEMVSAVALTFTVKYESGKTLTQYVDYSWFPKPWDCVEASKSGYEFETEINLNDSSFTKYTSGDILLKGTDKAKSISVKITPAEPISSSEYIDGTTKTATLNKIYFNPDAGKAKPIIEWAYQRGLHLQLSATFPADDVAYGVWDGNEYIGYYYRYSYHSNPMVFPNAGSYNFPLGKDAKAGAHKITVAKIDWSGSKAIPAGEKATYTLNVPAPASAPVTIDNDLTFASGTVKGTFWNNNPKASWFEVNIYDNSGTLKATDWVYAKSPSLAEKGAGYDDYYFSKTVSGSGPFQVVIKTVVYNSKKYTIEKEFISNVFLTNGKVIPRKQ